MDLVSLAGGIPIVFFAAFVSPGFGALAAGVVSWALPAPFIGLACAAAAGGWCRDMLRLHYDLAHLDAPGVTERRLPARLENAFDRFPCLATIGLQSIQLFRWDLTGAAARRGMSLSRLCPALAAGSLVGAFAGAAVAAGVMEHCFGPGNRGAAQPILYGLIALSLVIAEVARIVLERQFHRFDTPS
ncbi:hypothetical protein [Sutterella sp.]|uniref:hypothetical protein n=1 Tax=Sutterella sp. TaxID=1981025 RepID=UPI0026E01765|nr:hypothetical protein [Sutterella sp.]MDO5530472.1 hypothetical protein [Sutterella sp.]